MSARLYRWLIFGVVVALLPLITAYVSRRTDGLDPAWTEQLGRGELFLICAGVCSAAYGEVLGTGSGLRAFKILAGGICLIALLVSSSIYAHITERVANNAPIAMDVICHDSLFLYLIGVAASAACVVLAEVAP
ncbi:MAG: hypothetical protein JSR48_04960 [Verrucomicrobia bacterium]|nr:hypothetical protein [Verrucomicrobiota bacterium]